MAENRTNVTLPGVLHRELKIECAVREMQIQAGLEEAVALWLSIPPEKLDEVRQFISQWKPAKRRSEQKRA